MPETPVRFLGLEDPWKMEELPTPVFWPGEFYGQRSLAGSPWGHKESDLTERLSLHRFRPFPEFWLRRFDLCAYGQREVDRCNTSPPSEPLSWRYCRYMSDPKVKWNSFLWSFSSSMLILIVAFFFFFKLRDQIPNRLYSHDLITPTIS